MSAIRRNAGSRIDRSPRWAKVDRKAARIAVRAVKAIANSKTANSKIGRRASKDSNVKIGRIASSRSVPAASRSKGGHNKAPIVAASNVTDPVAAW